jgi:hypothetical protein
VERELAQLHEPQNMKANQVPAVDPLPRKAYRPPGHRLDTRAGRAARDPELDHAATPHPRRPRPAPIVRTRPTTTDGARATCQQEHESSHGQGRRAPGARGRVAAEPELRDYLGVLRRRKATIALTALAVTGAALIPPDPSIRGHLRSDRAAPHLPADPDA